MGQIVYVDLFFLVNFSMDFLAFFLTAKILSRPFPLVRAFMGAALGGLYADAALFFPLPTLPALLIDAVVCAVMCTVTFGERKKWRGLPLYILVYVAVSMTLGGIMTALFHLLNRSALFSNAQAPTSDGISVWVFALLALVSAVITALGGRFCVGRTAQKNAEVELCYEGKTVRLHAMTDSGNLLTEPMSGRPCIVADVRAVSPILPREIVRAAEQNASEAMEKVSPKHAKHLRLIPTRTASGSGMLLGVRMERITVDRGKGKKRDVDAIVVLSALGQSADGNEALLPPSLLVG